MEKQKMQFKARNVGFIVPIGLYLLFAGMLSWGSVVSARSFPIGVMATWGMAIPVLTILSLFCSYLFSHLYTKNKKWGCWGFILYIGAIILYTYLLSKNWGLVFWMLCSNLRSLTLGVLNMMCPTIWGLLDPQCGT